MKLNGKPKAYRNLLRQSREPGNALLRRQIQRPWRAPQLHRKTGRATNLQELLAVPLKLRMFRQRCADLAKDARGMFVRGFSETVVHPLAFAPRADDAGAPQVSQMTRNLWLADLQNYHEEADANL